MNERIRELRNALGLSGAKFGERIGLTRMAISNMENGRYGITEANLLSICREFNVNEDWLRTGEGDMFKKTKSTFLADLKQQYSLSDSDVRIIERYLELPPHQRSIITEFVASCAEHSNDEEI